MDTRTRRPDLERLEVKNPGWITPQLAPVLGKEATRGTQFYSDLITDESAQTGRSSGSAPNEKTITDSYEDYNLTDDEFIQRVKVADDDIEGLGGLAAAQMKAGRKGKRAVGKAIEDLTVANTLDNGDISETDIGSSILDDIEDAYWTVADNAEGNSRIVMACSNIIFSLLKRYTEVKDRMKHTGVIAQDVEDVRGISAMQMAGVLNVDGVIVGPKDSWYTGATAKNAVVLIALPSDGVEPDEEAQFARTLWFSPTAASPAGANMVTMHSYYSEEKLSEMVDSRAYAEQKVFNPELAYRLVGVDSGPTS